MSPSQTSSEARVQQLIYSLDRVCVSITASKPEQMMSTSDRLLKEHTFQEFRLDFLDEPLASLGPLGSFLLKKGTLRALATCRPVRSGGQFRGQAEEEVQVLLAAAAAGFPLVDLSLESAEELGRPALDRLREQGTAVVVSFHDFVSTGDLRGVLERMRSLRPDLGKVVSTATSLADSLAVLQLLRDAAASVNFPVVALAMGEPGVPSRILGPQAGAPFTFAAATESEATAPGQLTARVLTERYRMRELGPSTRLFGVAGDPIRSSLSPLMLNTAFRETGVDAVYLPLKTSDPAELLHAARELSMEGFSVTMPLKQAILPMLDDLDAEAAQIGAVNTVQRTADGSLHGFNSDVAGIVGPLRSRLELKGARVLVLGAGGAARAAVCGCAAAGADVSVYNRTQERAEMLARKFKASALERSALAARSFDVLINATPAGMRGNALLLPVEENELNAGLVFDLVYNPTETPLLALARKRGIPTIPGVEMFVHQGARQFEIWTGRPAPKSAMEAIVRQALAAAPA